MNCEQFGEQLELYWELPNGDPVKEQLSSHIRACKDCAEQVHMLDESRELVRQVTADEPQVASEQKIQFKTMDPHFSEHVMQRIYKEDSWRLPVAERMYSFSFKVHRNITILIAFFLALFIISFVHLAFFEPERHTPTSISSELDEFSGLMPVASANVNYSNDPSSLYDNAHGLAVASIQDPLILNIGTDPTSPDYLLIFSILGMAVTILVMNWFSRIRST